MPRVATLPFGIAALAASHYNATGVGCMCEAGVGGPGEHA